MKFWTTSPKIANIIINMRIVYILVLHLPVLLICLTPTLIFGEDWTSHCSANCTCKWTNGKKSAICNSLHLTTIPTTLSTEIQVLVLNDNQISYLNREEFTTLGLINLQRIYLKKSEIQHIHKEAFKNLKILVEIDLSDNKIEMLDKDTFSGNDRLRILYLNGNPLKRLHAYQFPILPHLRSLDLHDCLINYIDPLAFANLNLLEFLYLKNNLLENLSEYVFQHMINLKTLILDENPWQCNCKLRGFRNWYVKSKVNSISLICKGPFHHKDKHWENIDEEQFGCPPKVKFFSNEDVQNIDIGSNVTFSCLVSGDPMPTITWELNGKNFDNDNVLFDEEIIASDKIWSNLTVFNMTSLDAGTYSCSAQNIVGFASQNVSIYLSEIVQHVLVKTPETFWYFGLIMGTFGTVFLLILLSFVVCLIKRTRRRRHSNKNIKGSVSFNDQEKKLLDLSITTTNERPDSCGIDNGTPSMNRTESVIGFEPIEITVENRNSGGGGGIGGLGNVSNVGCVNNSIMIGGPGGGIVGGGPSGISGATGSLSVNSANAALLAGNTNSGCGGGAMLSHEEFPLNVGVFPPPPEFCSNVVANPAYGNIFISVSVTQDMLDSSDINIYPDLLNIPKQRVVDNSTTMLPVNVSSFATLPRRRGILKKDSNATNLYPHDEIVSYNNLETSYSNLNAATAVLEQHQTTLLPPPPPPTSSRQLQQQQQQQQQQPRNTSSKTSTCINCMKAQPNPYSIAGTTKDDIATVTSTASPTPMVVGSGPPTRQCSIQTPLCLKYDNMGKRITASGNSTLSLPDEEHLENETIFNENCCNSSSTSNTSSSCRTTTTTFGGSGGNNSSLQNSISVSAKPQQTQIPSISTSTATTTTNTDCLETNNDFVSL